MNIEEIIERIKQGDNDAFSELYNMTYKKAYVEAMSFMKDEDKAKEALQIAYIQIAKNIQQLQDVKAIYKWINIIVANVCKKQLMKRKEFSFSDYEDDKAIVLGFINELPTEQRTALVMQIYDGMKISEIAEIFETNDNTIKSRLNYAKKAIKQKLEEYKKAGNTLFVIPLIVYLEGIFESYETSIQVSEDVYANIAIEVESVL
ncbi:MAG: RNA polymerase sigma factor [Erysipelotrichaceae bacterium]|nr:RNA polymerase sigma factor [Erysipelotrichaceae bacterium]